MTTSSTEPGMSSGSRVFDVVVRKSAQARDNERQAYGNGEEEQRRPVIVSYDAHDQAAYGGTNDVRDASNGGGYAERHALLFLRERRPYFGVRYGNNAAGANGLYQAAGEQDGEAIKHLRQAANKRAAMNTSKQPMKTGLRPRMSASLPITGIHAA